MRMDTCQIFELAYYVNENDMNLTHLWLWALILLKKHVRVDCLFSQTLSACEHVCKQTTNLARG